MDTANILRSTKAIQEHERALAWLLEHGRDLAERDSVTVRVDIRGSEQGHMAAASALAELALAALPSYVPMAIEVCRKSISNERAAIQRELMETVA